MKPAGLVHDWYAGPAVDLEAIRAAARRCCERGYGPARIHLHAYSADCDGQRHETVATAEQLRLAGVELGPVISRG